MMTGRYILIASREWPFLLYNKYKLSNDMDSNPNVSTPLLCLFQMIYPTSHEAIHEIARCLKPILTYAQQFFNLLQGDNASRRVFPS